MGEGPGGTDAHGLDESIHSRGRAPPAQRGITAGAGVSAPPEDARLPRPLRPRAGRAAALARRLRAEARPGREARQEGARREAVLSLTRPPKERLNGPAPHDDDGHPLAPADAWGHDHLWWLDRMVRTNRPLVERMTLVWHDWFATSQRRRRLAAADAPPERALPEARARLVRRPAARRSRATRRCCVWLSGVDNTKDAPNENYGREMMELFTLGAGRGYTENDVREQARALTGFRNDWDDGVGPDQLPLRRRLPRRRHEEGSSASAGASTGATPAGSASTNTQPPVVLRREALVLLRPDAARPSTPQRALQRLYVGATTRSARSSRRSSATRTSTRARAWSSRRSVYVAGLLRGMRRGVDTDSWTWIGHLMRPAALLSARTWPAGTTPAGSTAGPGAARWYAAADAAEGATGSSRTAAYDARRPEAGGRPGARVLGQPDDLEPDPRGAARVRAARRGRRRQPMEEEAIRSFARTRCACWSPPLPTSRPADDGPLPLRRLLPHQPPEARCRRWRAHASRAREPGAPAPGGLGTRPPPVPAARRGRAGERLRRLAARLLRIPGGRRGGRGRPARARARLDLPARAASTRSRCSRRSAIRTTGSCGRSSRWRDSEGTPFAEDGRLHWHPSAAGFSHAARRGQGHGDAGDRLRAPGPVALQLAPLLGGRRARPAARDRLARALPRPRRDSPTTRSRGSRSTASSRPRSRPREMPVSAVNGPGDYDFWAPGVWGDVENWMLEAMPAIAGAHAGGRDAGLQQARADRASSPAQAPPAAAAVRGPEHREPGRLPDRRRLGLLRSGSRRSRRCSPPACRCASSRSRAPGDYDTHDNQADDLAEGPEDDRRLACSPSSATSRRAGSRTGCWSRSGPSSAAAARRTAPTGPTTARPGAGFLIGTRARGQMIGEFPGLANLDEDGNLRATADFRGDLLRAAGAVVRRRRGRGDARGASGSRGPRS